MACVLLGACSSTSSSGVGSAGTSATVTSTSAAATTPAATTSATVTTASTTTAPTSAKATTTAPATSAATTAAGAWTLGVNGLGPLVLGTKLSVLEAQGYVTAPTDECESSRTSMKLQDEGVWLYPKGSGATAVLAEIGVTKATYATVSGAKVGDTTIETKNGNGGPFQVGDTAKVQSMMARTWSLDLMGEC
jgi:hypothetical protein